MSRATEYAKQITREREKALRDMRRAYERMNSAKAVYEEAVIHASGLGITNTEIGRTLGISEAAVRAFVKRRFETAV